MRWMVYIMCACLMILGLPLLFPAHDLFMGILCIVFGITPPMVMPLSLRMSVKAVKKSTQGYFGLPYTISFFAGEYVDYNPRGEMHTPYEIVYKIVETADFLILYQNRVTANIVDKSKMTKGTAEELTAFLRVRCPVPYTYAGK